MIYKCIEKIKLTRTQLDRCNELFEIDFDNVDNNGDYVQQDLIDKLNAYRDDTYCGFVWDFENGSKIYFDICSGSSNYYDNVMLVDKNGNEYLFDCDYSLYESMDFKYNNDTYICEFEIIKE